jgi:hypothetical protein
MPHEDLNMFQLHSRMPQESTSIALNDSEMHLQAPSRRLSHGRQLQAIAYPQGEATCTCVPRGQPHCRHSIAFHFLVHDCASTSRKAVKL